ncbi:MAG: molybdopterin-binding protein, partial [Eubacterium sp.]
MQLLTVDDLGQAREKIKERFGSHLLRCEKIPAADSLGRVLGEGVDARNNVPHFRRSTVDGYAVRAKDIQGASESIPALLTCIEEVVMGAAAQCTLTLGTCAYVPTGGMLPEGADAMVMVEYSEVFSGDEVAIYTSVAAGDGVVQIGEDFGEGEGGLHRGTRIRAQEIGVMAALGIQEVSVYTTLKVAIISTGDELIPGNAPLEPGKIRDVNTSALAALAQEMGMAVVSQVLVPDVWESIEAAIAGAMAQADL